MTVLTPLALVAVRNRHEELQWKKDRLQAIAKVANQDRGDLLDTIEHLTAGAAVNHQTLKDAILVIKDFLPNISKCVLQSYARLNDVLIKGERLIVDVEPLATEMLQRLEELKQKVDDLESFRGDVMAGCDIQKAHGLYRQVKVVIGPGLTQTEIDRNTLVEAATRYLDPDGDEQAEDALRAAIQRIKS